MRSTFYTTSNSYPGSGQAVREQGRSPADVETARFFSELRRYLRLSIAEAARRVGTHPDAIAALEAGRIDGLPVWSETARIVSAYIGLARLDPRPALDRLSVLIGVAVDAPSKARDKVAAPAGGDAANPVSRIMSRLSETTPRVHARTERSEWFAEWMDHIKSTAKGLAQSVPSARAPVGWVLAAAFALILLASVAPSGVLQASVGGIAQPISGLWRKLSGEGQVVRVIMRDGLKWIEADDPRERRSDKLPSHRS